MNTQLHRSFSFLTALALALAITLAQAVPVHAAAGDTTRVSLNSSGVEGNESSGMPSISADGRYVAFQSRASNLVSGDANGEDDVFLRDTLTNTTTRLSLSSSGVEGNSWSSQPSISADGRFVAFHSNASNLVSGDTNAMTDVFVRDTLTNATTRLSLSSSGVEGNNDSNVPSISADGRYVAFHSDASNLVSGDSNAMTDVFVRDTLTNTTARVSLSSSGVEGNMLSHNPSISADGRYVAFYSYASNLVSGDANGAPDVFVRDTLTNTTTRVSLSSSGVEGNSWSDDEPSISADGRYVAFASNASNLVSGDTNGQYDIFLRDTLTNTTTRLSLDSSGVEGNAFSHDPSVSADGRYVTFQSSASNLVSGDANGALDVFVRDTLTNTTARVSLDSSGVEGNYSSGEPSISADGRYVAFHSDASNLVSGDTNGAWDIFLHETSADATPPAVVSITRADPNPTSAATVDFTVTFTEAVTGVNAGSFAVVRVGPATGFAYIISVTPVSASVYTVTVNTGTGNFTLRLDVPTGIPITDLAGNPLGGLPYTGGEEYTITRFLLTPLDAADTHTLRPAFDWADYPAAIGYNIQISRNNTFTQLISNTTLNGATNSSYTPTLNLTANATLYWRVRAKLTLTTYSGWSEIRSFHTGNPPGVPMLVSPGNNALVTSTAPLLNWNNSTLPAGTTFNKYEVEISTNNTFTAVVANLNVVGLANSQVNTPALANAATYYWRVRSWNTAGDFSAWSSVRSFRVPFAAPTLTAPANGLTLVPLKPTFTWTAITGATTYTLQVSKSATFNLLVINKTLNALAYTHTMNLTANTVYYWRVRANGPFGPGLWQTVVFSFTTTP